MAKSKSNKQDDAYDTGDEPTMFGERQRKNEPSAEAPAPFVRGDEQTPGGEVPPPELIPEPGDPDRPSEDELRPDQRAKETGGEVANAPKKPVTQTPNAKVVADTARASGDMKRYKITGSHPARTRSLYVLGKTRKDAEELYKSRFPELQSEDDKVKVRLTVTELPD